MPRLVHGRTLRFRAALLLPAGALLVHQLRYLLAYGPNADGQLAAQGHAYLSSVEPWIVFGLGVGFARFVVRVADAFTNGSRASKPVVRPLALWIATTPTLVVLYVSQELAEGVFADGHPAGIAGIFGDGGWWAILAAAAVAVVIVALLGAADVLVSVAARTRRSRRAARLREGVCRGVDPQLRRIAPLARAAAGRAPPLALVG